MPTRPPRSCPRCAQPVPYGQPCPTCQPAAQRDSDQARGSSHARGYGSRHRTHFRAAVLRRDPTCTCPGCTSCAGHPCLRLSNHADHHPHSRRELTALGHDPDDPQHGRGLCHPCHSHHTTQAQPGGWNRR